MAGLPYGPLGADTVHLCIDMQRLFAEPTEWHTPWMERVLPRAVRLARAHPERNVFTRFLPPHRPEDMSGTWRRYYQRWRSVTGERAPAGLTDLVAPLATLVPPGVVFDKHTYSPWHGDALAAHLRQRGAQSLVISGAETDVCVLATVLGAVDLGFRVVLPTDALCSSSDHTHDALLTLYHERFGQQIEAASSDDILAAWQAA